MTDPHELAEDDPHPLHPYVSDLALSIVNADVQPDWVEIDGTLAFFDVSGFTRLTEALAALGRAGSEYITDVLNTLFEGLIDEVFRGGGDVLEFGGDAMVVLFTGNDHERRAAVATAAMFRFMTRDGRIATPLGDVRLRMSCGMATGCQQYHLLGATRLALVVAGPISTEMAELEATARADEALVNARLAAALPSAWVDRRRTDGALRLRLTKVPVGEPQSTAHVRLGRRSTHTDRLLPTQFRSLLAGRRRTGELRQVAMSFLRLDGTDDLLASRGVAELHRRLGEITDVVDTAAADLDVCWLETQAEANSVRWTLIAGAPTATERDGERLLRVLRRIADESPVPLRIGANHGVVYAGDMGHPQRCTYIVMGDATNLAARLMTRAQPGEVVVGERLRGTCPRRFQWTPLEPFLVKGKRVAVRAFLLGRIVDDEATPDESPSGPLIGRDREVAELLDVVANGGTVELVGDAGVGKTRLWNEVRRVESGRQWFVIRAQPHETASPYLPFRRLLRAAASIDPHADAESAGIVITEFVARLEPALLPWLPLIGAAIGADVPMTAEVEALDPAFRTDRLLGVLTELILAVTGPGAVTVFEDVHWIDEGSRAAIEVLGRSLAPGSTLLLTRRGEGWQPSVKTTLVVAAIGDEFAEELLLRELPSGIASDSTVAALRKAAAGNPLYLIELARSVGMSAPQPGTTYPESVERLLAARIDRLPVAGRELIRDASVLGSTVSLPLAGRVLDRPDLIAPVVWERELGDLVTVVRDDEVEFAHDLVRVAAYEGLSVRRRRALHRRAGAVIEQWGEPAPIADPVAALAFHATGSGDPERIVECNQRAAEAAMSRGAMEIAEWLLGDVADAQRAVGAAAAARGATQRLLAIAAERAGHPEKALDALTHASRLAEREVQGSIAVDKARVLEKLGRYRSALITTARALRTSTDPEATASLRLARATIRNFRGEWKECLALSRELIRDFEGTDSRRLLAQAHLLAEWCCTGLGLPERGEHEHAAEGLLTELDDALGLANLLLNRGESAWRESRPGDAVADFRRSSEQYQRAGDVLGAALADNNLAEVLTLQFRLDSAEPLLVHARRVTEASNYPHGTLTTISGLSRIAAWRGRTDEALRLQSEALRGFRELGAEDLVLDSLVRLVEIHVIAGDAVAALSAADEAASALATFGNVPAVAAALARLRARGLLLAGRVSDARAEFESALDHARRDGATYEAALASLGIGRIDGDDARVEEAVAQLRAMDVIAPPPGS